MKLKGFAVWFLVGILALAAAGFFLAVRSNPTLTALPGITATSSQH